MAVTEAEQAGSAGDIVKVELMPGFYCPLSIPAASDNLSLVGVGEAGVDSTLTPNSYAGPESALSTFRYDAVCGPAPSGMISIEPGYPASATLALANLAIDGSSGTSDGMELGGPIVDLEAVLIQHETGAGVRNTSSELNIYNSAFTENGDGIAGYASTLERSLIADNQHAGIAGNSGSMTGDTISRNAVGVAGYVADMANTIVGDNSQADCDPAANFNPTDAGGYNLVGVTCNDGNQTNIALSDTIGPAALHGGPTPTILPPQQARGRGWLYECEHSTADQREFRLQQISSCDIGSVDLGYVGTPAPDTSVDPDMGVVAVGGSASVVVPVGNAGGDVIGVTDVTLSGDPDFSVSENRCSYNVFLKALAAYDSYCSVTVSATAVPKGKSSATLTVQTTGGMVTSQVYVTGATAPSAPGAPTEVPNTPHDGELVLNWNPPADDGGDQIAGYLVRYSSDAGTSWTDAPAAYDNEADVKGLRNGTGYVFEVAARNGYAAGPYSSPSKTYTPQRSDASSAAPARSTTIINGRSTKLTTRLTDAATGEPISHAVVALFERSDSKNFSPVSQTETNGAGTAGVTVSPRLNTTYKWEYQGDVSHRPASSSRSQVWVQQVVRAALSSHRCARYQSIDVYGVVGPHGQHSSVRLEQRRHGRWYRRGPLERVKVQRLPDGKRRAGFVLAFQGKHAGVVALRVVSLRSRHNLGGASRRLSLRVV